MKKVVLFILRLLASKVITSHKPLVIGITGSVGKTSAKDAIYTAINGSFFVRRNLSNQNNEFGVPLTILDQESAKRNIIGWLSIFKHGLTVIKNKANYPKVLVLEMGADHIGDIKYLTELTHPKIGVLTALGASHLENFETMDTIVKEKSQLMYSLPADGTAIFNIDDPLVATLIGKTKSKILQYGFSAGADIQASDFSITESQGILGITFKVNYQDKRAPVFIPNALSREQASAALAGLAVAVALNIPLLDAVVRLRAMDMPKGRLRPLKGLKNSLLIDDTYNASPQSAKAALRVLSELGKLKQLETWAVMGDMLELGNYSQAGHQEVGKYAKDLDIDHLVVVGTLAKDIAIAAQSAGMPEDRVLIFKTTAEVVKYLQTNISSNSLVLIKGSQGARMEKITKSLLLDPLQAETLLVRQSKEWQ